MVRRAALLIPLALAACASGEDARLAAIKDARSVLAEWSAVEREAAAGRVTLSYADAMRRKARETLAADRKAIGDAALLARITLVLDTPRPSAENLAAAGEAVEQAETRLEGE
ncbi:MAG: hypothetical protein ACJ8DZ_05515 [Allosphingosinicella sp.]